MGEVKVLSLRLDPATWETLRYKAYVQNTHISILIRQAIKESLERDTHVGEVASSDSQAESSSP